MEKNIVFNNVSYIVFSDRTKLEKFAAANSMDRDIIEVAEEASRNKSHKRNVVTAVSIVFPFEWYGENDNSDSFFENSFGSFITTKSTLPMVYKTFETGGRVFKYHKSKDPANAIGKIHYARYNWDQHRIELVIEVEWEKDQSTCLKLRRNKQISVSMGAKCPVDYCSVCGNAAATAEEHCEHIKYNLLDIIDGIPVHMINSGEIRFFDCSIVSIPGDINAKTIYTPKQD